MASDDHLAVLADLNFSAAVKALDKKIQNPGHDSLWKLHYNRGFCLQRLGLLRKALKDFDASIKTGQASAKAYYRRGLVQQALGKIKDANTSWQRSMEQAGVEDDLDVLCASATLLRNPDAQIDFEGASNSRPETQPSSIASPAQEAKALPSGSSGGGQPPPTDIVNRPCASKGSSSKAYQAHEAIGIAVEKVNAGKCAEAEKIVSEVIEKHPSELGAWVARGTARALMRNLKGAIEDFTSAIKIFPDYPDTWKRRGQAKSALGDHQGGLDDLQKCIDLTQNRRDHADPIVERALVYQKMRDFRCAVAEVNKALAIDNRNEHAWNLLGMCKTSLGDIEQGVNAYKKTLEIDPDHKEAWFNMFQALKEAARVEEAMRAYRKGRDAENRMKRRHHVGAFRVMASMQQGMGQHLAAIDYCTEALNQEDNEQMLECYFLRAACYHALGMHKNAVSDYTNCLEFEGRVQVEESSDRAQLVVLAFYQKELALYVHHKLDVPVASFCMDKDISPIFKELWCKKSGPTRKLIASYTMQRPLPSNLPAPPAAPDAEVVGRLVKAADKFGQLLQNAHQGFLPNKRQQRAAGLAVIELAQAVCEDTKLRSTNSCLQVMASGASGSYGKSEAHDFGWRDAMDIIVKWRQLSEPNDQVVWVDLLTPSEFEAGFGSHTPMFSGQTKCVRYYMNFKRALQKQKEILLKGGTAFNATNDPISLDSNDQKDAIMQASSASEMYKIIGRDSWVVVPIQSLCNPNQEMEGTRLTLVQVPNQPDGFEFSIRTPVTPSRWELFEADLSSAWARLTQDLLGDDSESTSMSILIYAYYWYNFMPLARGTAACGHSVLLALFWAAGMPIKATIPTNYQVDWEAILEQHPHIFANELYTWMVPDEGRPAALKGSTKPGSRKIDWQMPNPMDLPSVGQVLPTMRSRIEALNGRDMARI